MLFYIAPTAGEQQIQRHLDRARGGVVIATDVETTCRRFELVALAAGIAFMQRGEIDAVAGEIGRLHPLGQRSAHVEKTQAVKTAEVLGGCYSERIDPFGLHIGGKSTDRLRAIYEKRHTPFAAGRAEGA